MARYDPLKDLINWPATWSLASFSLYAGPSNTNFREDNIQSFRRKLMFDELPTMNNLCRRKFEIYKSEWKCFHCDLVHETCAHLWFCAPSDPSKWSRKDALKMIIDLARDSLKKHLIKIDRNRSRIPTLDWLPEFVALPCWSLTPSDTSFYSFDLLKGFVPWDLFDLVNSVTRNYTLSISLINKVLFKLQDRAFRYIWLLRCHDMVEWESLRQITAVMKRSKSHSNPTSSTQIRTKDQIVIHDRCNGWISLSTGVYSGITISRIFWSV